MSPQTRLIGHNEEGSEMADKNQVAMLRRSVEEWNTWVSARRKKWWLTPQMKRPDLQEANLSGANLSGAHLGGACLRGADLGGANLTKANLTRAGLSEVNLGGVNLAGACLDHADLSAANLTGANLSEADLTWAGLGGANLTKANLTKANLTKACLSGANFEGAIGIEPQPERAGEKVDGADLAEGGAVAGRAYPGDGRQVDALDIAWAAPSRGRPSCVRQPDPAAQSPTTAGCCRVP